MAEIKFLSDLKLMGGASIKNLRVENFATASIPVTGIDGQMVFDTDLNVLKFWDGTEWAAIQNDADLQDAIESLEARMTAVEEAVVEAQATADLADTRATDAQTRVGVLEPQVAQALLDIVTAQETADLADTHATDAQTRVGVLEPQVAQALLDIVTAQETADLADTRATDAQTRVGVLEPQVAQALLDIVTAQETADLADTRATDAQTRVGVLEAQNLDSRLSAVEADDAGDDAAIAAAQSAADAAQGTADQAVLDAAAAQATADLADTRATDAQTRVGVLEPQVAQALLDIVTAQETADLAEVHAADAQTRVGAIEAEDFPTRVVALENSALDHEGRLDSLEALNIGSELTSLDGRLDAIESAPYASEGFVTGITDGLDGRIDAIETAPYASEGFVAGAVESHNLDLDAHPRGIKWFTPTQLINGPVTDTVASQSGVSLTTAGTVVASLEAADPLAWLEFQGTVTVSGTGSATLEVEVQDSLSGVSYFGEITVTRGEAYPFEYMLQAPATGSAKDYDLVFKTVAGTETADFGAIAIDAFGSDPFVVKSELDALDTRVDAIEAWNWVGGHDFTITGDDVETAFSSAPISGNVYAAITVWEDATGQAVLVDLARVYDGGNDETTFTVNFNEAPADGATYTVAMKI